VLAVKAVEGTKVAEGTVEVRNKLGLHLRAASTLAQTAAKFASTVTITRAKETVNARSVTGLMMLGAGAGTKLKLKTEGPDADEAFKTVQALFADKFGEE
jgi:phosphocarrier protein HPr